jgi:hypothetical protein
MHHGARRPARSIGQCGDDLRSGGGIRTEKADAFGTRSAFGRVVSRHNPGARDGIFAEFHALGKHCGRSCVKRAGEQVSSFKVSSFKVSSFKVSRFHGFRFQVSRFHGFMVKLDFSLSLKL